MLIFSSSIPIGGLIFLIIALFLCAPRRSTIITIKRQLIRLDPLGTILFLSGAIYFLLAVQWGGVTCSWGNRYIIALLIQAGVLLIAFVGI